MKTLLILIFIPYTFIGQIVATEDCGSIPDPGYCFAYIQTFYFNQITYQCEESFWGGCDGVVPFWSLEDCQNNCENSTILLNKKLNTKQVVKTIGLLGRKYTTFGFQLQLFDDGSVEKKFIINTPYD